tara:strand:- start:286 stop:1062 length:777 start_codon:yes stop_codon:yes gene_type:complete
MAKIILMDMDGTITPARKSMTPLMASKLARVQSAGFELGIVSGSDMDYIKQQCGILFDVSPADWKKIHYFPCNGTKYYTAKNNKFHLEYAYDMKKTLGKSMYMRLIREIVDKHSNLFWLEDGDKIPMSGTFIKYRGSMVNWCPIGRDSDPEDRKTWVQLDNKNQWRKHILDSFRNCDTWKDITFKLGGETSFDIYPNGWDKTLSLKQFENYEKVYFIGDSCTPTGNDYEAYISAGDYGFETDSPATTIEILEKIMATQ